MSESNGESKNKDMQKKEPNYWRSFNDLYNDSDFVEASHHEFKEGVKDDFNPSHLSGISRRKFLALLGASAALAGAGCSDYRDRGEIIPYNDKPEEIIPGKANYYASTINNTGVLVKTREGRPIKIDGNPDHPVTKGKINSKIQASILSLYDPQRLQEPAKKRRAGFDAISWNEIDDEIINALNNAGDREIAVVANTLTSPTGLKVLEDFKKKYPSTKIYSYELFNESIRNSAWKKCYGAEYFPQIKWNEAKVIVDLEADFLGSGDNEIENRRLFAEGRNVDETDKFSRLYVVEGNYTLTGLNADYRLKLKPDAQYEFVMSLLNELNSKGVGGINLNTSGYSLSRLAEKYGLKKGTLNYLISDLLNNRGKSIIYAGKTLPEETHIAVNLLNEVLGNNKLYNVESTSSVLQPLSGNDEIISLVNKMKAGNVAVVIHYDSNPAYHFPVEYNYSEALKNVAHIISLSEFINESANESHYVLPINHQLESWGDYKTHTGFYSLQQPVISPIYNTRQKEEILAVWATGDASKFNDKMYHQYLMDNWQKNIYTNLNSPLSWKQFWNSALHDGIVLSNETSNGIGSFNPDAASNLKKPDSQNDSLTVVLKESYYLGDGRYADNGWLQELPHPVTKVTWDNYAAISLNTAKELGVETDDLIKIEINGRSVEIPVFIQPGAADKTVSIELGYGRKHAGIVGNNIGFNANVLVSYKDGLTPWLYNNVSVTKAGGSYELVSAQEHFAFDKGITEDVAEKRDIVKEGTLKEYINNPHFLHKGEGHELHTFYPNKEYKDVKWGMSIDMNKCIACNDCVTACQAENNIPTVGKDQVKVGREMHWIRIDRYYSGNPEEPKVSNQVMVCQHCDHAPCENVCPVVATTHSPDGLNQMVYNRCVGTRYCSNNCPYKVRRFNFFNFRDHFRDAIQESEIFGMVYNPEVTVRSRGVMEKCTFCIQRISEAREEAIRENIKFTGAGVKTACQEACPTDAIKFGNYLDKDSEFRKYREHELGYYVLEDLNVRPNVTYIAKLRNTHTEEA